MNSDAGYDAFRVELHIVTIPIAPSDVGVVKGEERGWKASVELGFELIGCLSSEIGSKCGRGRIECRPRRLVNRANVV